MNKLIYKKKALWGRNINVQPKLKIINIVIITVELKGMRTILYSDS